MNIPKILLHPVYGKYIRFAVRALVVLAVVSIILFLIIWPIPIVGSTVVSAKVSIPRLAWIGFTILSLYYVLPHVVMARFEKETQHIAL